MRAVIRVITDDTLDQLDGILRAHVQNAEAREDRVHDCSSRDTVVEEVLVVVLDILLERVDVLLVKHVGASVVAAAVEVSDRLAVDLFDLSEARVSQHPNADAGRRRDRNRAIDTIHLGHTGRNQSTRATTEVIVLVVQRVSLPSLPTLLPADAGVALRQRAEVQVGVGENGTNVVVGRHRVDLSLLIVSETEASLSFPQNPFPVKGNLDSCVTERLSESIQPFGASYPLPISLF